MSTKPQFGISNVQRELLTLYSNNVNDEQLLEIKSLLARYFAAKATEAMDIVWDEQNLNEEDMHNWTKEHNRRESSH
jgi:hypothetical protein